MGTAGPCLVVDEGTRGTGLTDVGVVVPKLAGGTGSASVAVGVPVRGGVGAYDRVGQGLSLAGGVEEQLQAESVVDDPVDVLKVGVVLRNGYTLVGCGVEGKTCLALAATVGR